jgi:signal transduction histidine kinase
MLAQEDALLAGVAAAGRMTAADHSQLVQAIGMQRTRYADAVAELPETDQAAYQNLAKSEAAVRLRALEDRVVAKGQSSRTLPVDVIQWSIAYDVVAGQLRDIELTADTAVAERAERAAAGPRTGLWLAGILLLVVALGFALWLGRSRWPGAGRLRDVAAYLARGRLRGVLLRVHGRADSRAGTGSPRRDGGVAGYASQEVRRATRPALSEIRPQQGLYEVFLAMALRSQELLHRQLALLDGMERRFTEPADLAEVFRVDHLATRMRRHVEDAITLADAVPGRGWRKPVPMIDVIRGAVSEVEEYTRVTTLAVANVGLVGRAVGDTIHLLAELIENGTSFSPPDARVEVSGCLVPNGFVIEVEDRGVGMATDALAEANRRLAEPTSFDPAASPYLGLYVVARLARRHGIGVRLRPSPYGGISAVVLVPPDLVAVGLDVSLAELAPAASVASVASVASAGDAERVVELGPTEVTTVDQPARTGSPLPVRGGPALSPKRAGERIVAPEPMDERIVAAQPVDEPVVAVGTTTGGLPRRIPQASLAAQLRDVEPPAGEPAQASPAGARTAERTRARLSAFQKGTARGRQRPPVTGAASSQAPALGDESATDTGRPQE